MVARFAAVIAVVLATALTGTTSAATADLRPAGVVVQHAGHASAKQLPCSPKHGLKLVWHGGPVWSLGLVLIVYWGPWWHSHGQAVKSELSDLYADLGTSKWAATLSQYCGKGGARPAVSYGFLGSVIDDTNPSKSPTDKQLGAVAAAHSCGSELCALTIVVTPHGTAPAFDVKSGSCGHHSWVKIGRAGDVPWVDIPYGIIQRHACGFKLRQGTAGAISVVAGHEWAEAITDPFVSSSTAWATSGRRNDQEVADLCESQKRHHFFILKLKTGSFVMQKLWSNKVGKCVESS